MSACMAGQIDTGQVCSSEAVFHGHGVCVHEHIVETALCAEHLAVANKGGAKCGPCFRVDGHHCQQRLMQLSVEAGQHD